MTAIISKWGNSQGAESSKKLFSKRRIYSVFINNFYMLKTLSM